jgi:hypothetical protein
MPKIVNRRFLFIAIAIALSTTLVLAVAEGILRLVGFQAGYASHFEEVGELRVEYPFITDDLGFFRANPEHDWPRDVSINSDGYRGEPLIASEDGSVLFLGDSFTWGASAQPITGCFVDLVGEAGFRVYNTGIPGTDPQEYAEVAKRYVSRLQPDAVVTIFSISNDFRERRPMRPHENLWHITNAGWLYGYDEDGQYRTPEEAYRAIAEARQSLWHELRNARSPKAAARAVLLRTVIGTRFWFFLQSAKARSLITSGMETNAHRDTMESLEEIGALAEKCGARFLLFVVPPHPSSDKVWRQELRLLEGFNPRLPDNLKRDDYEPLPDGHFNNAGHRKFADFILAALENEMPGADER